MRSPRSRDLDSAIPIIVITFDIHGQERTIAAPALIFRQLDLLLGIRIALSLSYRLLHRGGKILQVVELVDRFLPGSDLPATGPRMAGNDPVPIHRDHLLQSLLDVG